MVEVTILFGGRSVEHNSSIYMYYALIDSIQHDSTTSINIAAVMYISQTEGVDLWLQREKQNFPPRDLGHLRNESKRLTIQEAMMQPEVRDSFMFSLLQGTEGEDGAFQGLASVLDIRSNLGPVFGSALSMNKWAQGLIAHQLASTWLTEVPTWLLHTNSPETTLRRVLGETKASRCVLKPNELGASAFCEPVEELSLTLLSDYQRRVNPFAESFLVQKRIFGREYSVGLVRVNGEYLPLDPIEISSRSGFLGMEEKFSTGGYRIHFISPADSSLAKTMQDASLAIASEIDYGTICRFDYISDGEALYLLEVNSKPGLTAESHFTLMLERAGISLSTLVDLSIKDFGRRFSTQRVLDFKIEKVFQ